MPAPLTYSWIALAASAPVILLLTTWTLAVFHCRRRQWSTIDIFLVSILSQSVLQQFLGFIYSILSLIKLTSKSTGDTICTGLLWFFISIPIFKGATIISLAIDRWLFSSKFEYRLYIRKNHIRYHIGVLAILSCTVGFAALLTLNSSDLLTDNSWLGSSTYSFDQCTFIPFKFDLKFVIFYIGVHTIIVISGLFAIWKASCCNCARSKSSKEKELEQSRKKHKRVRKHLPLDLTPSLSNTSTASSSVSAENPVILQFSTPGHKAKAVLSHLPPLEQQHAQRQNKIFLDHSHQNKKDVANYHRESTSMGLLVLTIIFTHIPLLASTTFSTYVMNAWNPNSGLSLSIIPLNWPVTNILLWGQVVEGLSIILILLTVDSIVPTWIFQCKKRKKRNFQQLFQPNLTNITTVNTKKSYPSQYQLNNNTMALQSKATGGLASEYKNNKFPITNGSLFASLTAAAVAAASSAPNKVLGNDIPSSDNGNIYMSLSNDFDSIATASIDQISLDGDDDEDSKKFYHQRCASVTTVANDDFEFHHALPVNQVGPPQFNPRTFTLNKKQQMFGQPYTPHDQLNQTNVQFPAAQQPYQYQQQLTSLSMNDLDLITELEPPCSPDTRKPTTSTAEYKQQRMYRKRPRIQCQPVTNNQHSVHQQANRTQRHPIRMSDRRVLSLECLTSNLYHANKNGFDVSYLDTGDLCLVRQGDGSRCIFVTDFI